MKNYYQKIPNVYVRVDTTTKEVVNVLNLFNQKTISVLNNQQHYDIVITYIPSWTTIDENTFNTNYNEVLTYLNNL